MLMQKLLEAPPDEIIKKLKSALCSAISFFQTRQDISSKNGIAALGARQGASFLIEYDRFRCHSIGKIQKHRNGAFVYADFVIKSGLETSNE
jgi:hypothetical protein